MAVGWEDAAYQAAVRAVEGLPPVPAHALERIRPLIGPALRAGMAAAPTASSSVGLPAGGGGRDPERRRRPLLRTSPRAPTPARTRRSGGRTFRPCSAPTRASGSR